MQTRCRGRRCPQRSTSGGRTETVYAPEDQLSDVVIALRICDSPLSEVYAAPISRVFKEASEEDPQPEELPCLVPIMTRHSRP